MTNADPLPPIVLSRKAVVMAMCASQHLPKCRCISKASAVNMTLVDEARRLRLSRCRGH